MVQKRKPKQETKIDIYRAWCKSCGICVAFCPSGALVRTEDGSPAVGDEEKCIRCGWCELRCPDFAIRITPQGKSGEGGGEE